MNIVKNFILSSIIFLLILSFYQIFILSQNLYFLSQGEKEVQKLIKEVKKLEVELSEVTSLSNLDQFLTTSQLIKAPKTKFIEVFESGVVAR